MFRGKKYQESAKLVDRSVQYDPNEALDLVVKGASAKFDETVEIHIKLGVDSVTLTSRSVAQLFCPTVPVRPAAFWSSPRTLRLRTLRLQALTMSAAWSWLRRSPRRTGSSSTWLLLPPT